MHSRFNSRCLLLLGFVLLAGPAAVLGQKGVDTQTTTIKAESNKVTSRPNDASRSIDFGKGKTRVREPLANPYRLGGRRDTIIAAVLDVLRERKMTLDDISSRMSEGILVTQPFVFAKGAVITQSELGRYGIIEPTTSSWIRAQYTLTIEIQPIDGVQNNVSVNARVEGRAGNGLMSEWVTVRSSGLAEDEFLSKLVEAVTGVSPEPVQDTDDR